MHSSSAPEHLEIMYYGFMSFRMTVNNPFTVATKWCWTISSHYQKYAHFIATRKIFLMKKLSGRIFIFCPEFRWETIEGHFHGWQSNRKESSIIWNYSEKVVVSEYRAISGFLLFADNSLMVFSCTNSNDSPKPFCLKSVFKMFTNLSIIIAFYLGVFWLGYSLVNQKTKRRTGNLAIDFRSVKFNGLHHSTPIALVLPTKRITLSMSVFFEMRKIVVLQDAGNPVSAEDVH